MEPGRKPETPSWYLLADGERLTLSEYVDIDVDEFDRLLVEASAWAVRAHRESPLDERAVRLLMSCLVATGDRVAALETADKLYAALQEAGLEPERLLSSS